MNFSATTKKGLSSNTTFTNNSLIDNVELKDTDNRFENLYR